MKCCQCQAEMAKVQSSVALVHGENKKKYTSISLWGDIDTYVCPMCGFMGFHASNYTALRPKTKPLFEDENIPCKNCGGKDMPLHSDYLCPECHEKEEKKK